MATAQIGDEQLFDVKDQTDIVARCSSPTISTHVDRYTKAYYVINVEEAMQKLTQVGELLQFAFASSKPHPCSTSILNVLGSYQDLVKDSHVTSSTFVQVVLKALTYHKLAIILAQKERGEKAFELLSHCADLASNMVVECDRLIKGADNLARMSQAALLKTNEDRGATEEEKNLVIQKINEHNADNKKLDKIRLELQKAVEEARAEEEKHMKAAEKKERIGCFVGAIPVVGSYIAEGYNKGAKGSYGRAEEAKSFRRELQRKERDNNAELAKIVEVLKSSSEDQNGLEKTIQSLEITIKTLGKVKTIFSNVKQFWQGQANHLNSLKNTDVIQMLLEPDLKDVFIDQIKDSGFSWLSLGKINYEAVQAIERVDRNVDNIMCDLPTQEEAERLIGNLASKILGDINAENLKIEYYLKED